MLPKFVLTQAARDDLASLFAYGLDNFGEAVARKHLQEIKKKFLLLTQYPEIGQQREELFYLIPDLRSLTVAPDVIYYCPRDHGVTIVRVPRGEQDVLTALSDWRDK